MAFLEFLIQVTAGKGSRRTAFLLSGKDHRVTKKGRHPSSLPKLPPFLGPNAAPVNSVKNNSVSYPASHYFSLQ